MKEKFAALVPVIVQLKAKLRLGNLRSKPNPYQKRFKRNTPRAYSLLYNNTKLIFSSPRRNKNMKFIFARFISFWAKELLANNCAYKKRIVGKYISPLI